MTADKDALLREGMLKGYINHACLCEAWDGYACDCGLDSYRARITAALAEKDDGWIKCSGKDGAARNATFIDSELLGKYNICTERNGVWYARSPLPPLPKGE